MANEPFKSGSLYISCWKMQTKINERPPPTRIAKISTEELNKKDRKPILTRMPCMGMEMQNGVATSENSVLVSYIIKHTFPMSTIHS